MIWILYGLIAALVLGASRLVRSVTVRSGTTGIVYRNGVAGFALPPGRHWRFDPLGASEVRVMTTLRQPLEMPEATVMTKDQFSFRIRLALVVRVEDALLHARATVWHGDDTRAQGWAPQASPFAELYLVATAALLAQTGRMTLEAFLAEPTAILPAVRAAAAATIPGVVLEDILIAAVTMPPEVRKMFTEVERARHDALASLEKARGEQASLRALANAARALHGNPHLAQLRLLQTVETSKGPKTIVLGTMPPLPTGAPQSIGESAGDA